MGLDQTLYVNSKQAAKDSKRWHEENGYDGRLFDGSERSGWFAYWRKANHIHAWFEKELADGELQCGPMYAVGLETIEKLRDTCKTVLGSSNLVDGERTVVAWKWDNAAGKMVEDNHTVNGRFLEDSSVAEGLLPRSEGFFFGSQMYDDDYYDDTKYTFDLCNFILENMAQWRTEYNGEPMYDWHPIWPGDEDWYVDFNYYASW